MQHDLYSRLMSDLALLGIDLDFTLRLKPYNKNYFGKYVPKNKEITLYIYEDSACTKLYSYGELLDTLIHEFTHHVQFTNSNFKIYKGNVHDKTFFTLFNYYRNRLHNILLWRELKAS